MALSLIFFFFALVGLVTAQATPFLRGTNCTAKSSSQKACLSHCMCSWIVNASHCVDSVALVWNESNTNVLGATRENLLCKVEFYSVIVLMAILGPGVVAVLIVLCIVRLLLCCFGNSAYSKLQDFHQVRKLENSAKLSCACPHKSEENSVQSAVTC